MEEQRLVFEEGISTEKIPEPLSEIQEAEKSDYKKAIEIMLGYSDSELEAESANTQISGASVLSVDTEPVNDLIQKAKEFRISILKGMKSIGDNT